MRFHKEPKECQKQMLALNWDANIGRDRYRLVRRCIVSLKLWPVRLRNNSSRCKYHVCRLTQKSTMAIVETMTPPVGHRDDAWAKRASTIVLMKVNTLDVDEWSRRAKEGYHRSVTPAA